MTLFLHIGTEKTGSSYLQSLSAVNRNLLRAHGIWFPEAGKREKDLRQGEISPGNGKPLYDYLRDSQIISAGAWIMKQLGQARKQSCSRLLISNELLILVLSKDQVLESFLQQVHNLGIKSVKILLVLRDPVDQALSLFKHRSKNGTAPDLQEWTRSQYVYGKKLSDFLNSAKTLGIDLTCRKYQSESIHLEKLFFRDWLHIDDSLDKAKQVVNPSLSISELLFIKELRKRHPSLAKAFYERMVVIPKHEKSSDHLLVAIYRKWLNHYLSRYEGTWQICNHFLSKAEQLVVPIRSSQSINLEPQENPLSFSETQARALAELMVDCLKPGFRWQLRQKQYRHLFGKVKKRILAL